MASTTPVSVFVLAYGILSLCYLMYFFEAGVGFHIIKRFKDKEMIKPLSDQNNYSRPACSN